MILSPKDRAEILYNAICALYTLSIVNPDANKLKKLAKERLMRDMEFNYLITEDDYWLEVKQEIEKYEIIS